MSRVSRLASSGSVTLEALPVVFLGACLATAALQLGLALLAECAALAALSAASVETRQSSSLPLDVLESRLRHAACARLTQLTPFASADRHGEICSGITIQKQGVRVLIAITHPVQLIFPPMRAFGDTFDFTISRSFFVEEVP